MNEQELRQLFERFHSGELTSEEERKLEEALEDPAARALFVEDTVLSSSLRHVLKVQEEQAAGGARQQKRRKRSSRIRNRRARPRKSVFETARPIFALAAVVCIAVGAYLYYAPQNAPDPSQPQLMARIQSTSPSAVVLRDGRELNASEGLRLNPGDVLITDSTEGETGDAMHSVVAIGYPGENTSLRMGPDAKLAFRDETKGKRYELLRGTLEAEVAKQPAGKPMILNTPHGKAEVVGTQFRLRVVRSESASPSLTRLSVLEGAVKLSRGADTVTVKAGYFAEAGKNIPLTAKAIDDAGILFSEDFENVDAIRTKWNAIDNGMPTTYDKILEIDCSKNTAIPSAGTWQTPGGLITRKSFSLPLRISIKVWIDTASSDVINSLVFLPESVNDLGIGENGLFKTDVFQVIQRSNAYVVSHQNKTVTSQSVTARAPRIENWVLTVRKKSISLEVDGKSIFKTDWPKPLTAKYRICPTGYAKVFAPAGSRVRFDDLLIRHDRGETQLRK